MKFGIVTLGCDKNTVDSEYFAAEFAKAGVQAVAVGEEPAPGDDLLNGVLINTCGFIESSKSQSIAAILSWARLKKSLQRKHRHFRLLVAGCLSQRYAKELPSELPEVDGWLGVGDFRKIEHFLKSNPTERKSVIVDAPDMVVLNGQSRHRLDEGKAYHAFLKIGDGCSHKCSFCAIPLIKGNIQTSTPKEQVLREARELLQSGVRELCVVAQDTAAYGRDLYGNEYGICELLTDLNALDFPGEWWIRLLYVYPAGVTDQLLKVMANSPRILPYIDMPLQHMDRNVLTAMRRPDAKADIPGKLKKMRKAMPDLSVRTTFIVGFPGETAEQFDTLLKSVVALKFDRLGAFAYSLEEDTDAVNIKPHISSRVAQSRLRRLMEAQEKISKQILRGFVGKTVRVLVEEKIEQDRWVGRSWRDAPDVDGVVVIASQKELPLGTFVDVCITGSDVHDLMGEVV